MKEVKFTRKELYDLVWSESMLSLSKKYEISDVGLKKKCIKMNIPVPKVGYWAKVQYGQKVAVPKLPERSTGIEMTTLILRESQQGEGETEQMIFSNLRQQFESDERINLKVPEKLSNPDSLIAEVKDDLLRKDLWKGQDKLISSSKNHLDIRVTPQNLGRSLRILDTLIKAFRILGYDFKVKNGKVYLIIEEEEFDIILKENTEKGTTKDMWGNFVYVPNGKLSFKAEIGYSKNEWKDGKTLIEERISGILTKLILKAQTLKEERIAWEKKRKEQEERDRIAKELQKRKDKELQDFKELFKKAIRHDKAEIIRRYAEQLERSAIARNELTDEMKTLITWTKQKADWYDPFIEADDELLQDVDKEELTFKKKSWWG